MKTKVVLVFLVLFVCLSQTAWADTITDSYTDASKVDVINSGGYSISNGQLKISFITGFWPLNETSGATVADISGNGNTLTATGTTIVGGKYGNARSVINSTDMLNSASPYVDLGSVWTIEAWFQYPLASMASWNTLTRGNAGDHQIIVQRSNMHLGGFDNIGGTGFKDSGYVISGLSAGWHHIAAVGSGGKTTYYIDGNKVGNSLNWQSTTDVRSIGNYWGGGQAFGVIDDVRIYNTKRL